MKDFGGKREGMRPPPRPRHRWWNNIKVDLKVIGWVGWSRFRGSGYGQVAGCSEQGSGPSGFIKSGKFLNYLKTC